MEVEQFRFALALPGQNMVGIGQTGFGKTLVTCSLYAEITSLTWREVMVL